MAGISATTMHSRNAATIVTDANKPSRQSNHVSHLEL